MEDRQRKEIALRKILQSYGKVAIAFSGGVDSSFLLFYAADVLGKENVLPITLTMSMHTKREREETITLAQGFQHIFVEAEEYSMEGFVENGKERCYHCKKGIFEKILREAKERGFTIVADGTNFDDLDDYRPGLRALQELNIQSPLKEAGLTKRDIREISKERKIPTWNKPSKACLASRIPYGTKITPQAIAMVEACEDYLWDLGFISCRVRHHGTIARIEVPVEKIEALVQHREAIDHYFKSQGFLFVTLDLGGYQMGSLNLELKDRGKDG
ncbi:MAG: ATP-dependent sacrificial sulfur transferase LarE [Tissierellia bacterium]|nr:ATP-dependent sacrificial sulfur transferase LarE [Tissierellia bacterium]